MADRKKPIPRARRPRGTGSIFWSERRGCWVGRVPIGRGTSGKTVYAERCDVSQAKVVEKLKNVRPPGPTTTVGEWCERWLEGLAVRPSSVYSYKRTVKHQIKPVLGHVCLTGLTPHHIEQAAKKWADNGLGVNTVRLVLSHLSACLGVAVRAGAIQVNPVSIARKPRKKPKDIDPFSPAELAAIIAEASARPTAAPVALLAAIGCRVGECQALLVSDWNQAAKTIAITKTVGQRRSLGVGPPKSPNSVRTVRVPDAAVPAVVAAARGRKPTLPLFATWSGKYPTRNVIAARLNAILDRLGLRRRNLHQLRHSVATALISAGSPIGDAAKFLGDSPATVVATYLHAAGTDPTAVLDRLYGGGKVG